MMTRNSTNTSVYLKTITTPVGKLIIGVLNTDKPKCCLVEFESRTKINQILTDIKVKFDVRLVWDDHPYHSIIEHQLREYFMGQRIAFDLDLIYNGTEFQEKVWQYLLTIDYGKVITYKEIAESINNPQSVRAVGSANGNNHIAIIIPCHRVIGTNGQLVGYGGGLHRKKQLLELETTYSSNTSTTIDSWF